jgi:hypothetical protein
VAEGVDDGLGAIVDGEFAEDRGDVVFDGLVGDGEDAGDLFVAVALGNAVEDFDFARGERGEDAVGSSFHLGEFAELIEHAGGDEGAGEDVLVDQVFAAGDFADQLDDLFGFDVFGAVGGGADADGVEELFVVLVHSQDDDASLGVTAFEDAGDFKTAHLGHIDVDQDDIGHQHVGHLDGGLSVTGFADDKDVRFGFEAPTNASAKQWVIVNDQDLNAIHGVTP